MKDFFLEVREGRKKKRIPTYVYLARKQEKHIQAKEIFKWKMNINSQTPHPSTLTDARTEGQERSMSHKMQHTKPPENEAHSLRTYAV